MSSDLYLLNLQLIASIITTPFHWTYPHVDYLNSKINLIVSFSILNHLVMFIIQIMILV